MQSTFKVPITARWVDMDPNGHVRHSAYLDYSAHARIHYFDGNGYPLSRFASERIGPVLFSEHIDYRRELGSCESVHCDMVIAGLSENRKHWLVRHHIVKADGAVAAVLNCRGAWLDLDKRQVVPAPEALFTSLEKLIRAADFKWL